LRTLTPATYKVRDLSGAGVVERDMTALTLPTRRLIAGLATAALASGAAAGAAQADGFTVNDPALNVPANKIEHVVREVQMTGHDGHHTLDELYLGSNRAHWISRDATTGKIVRETTFDHGTSLAYDAAANEIDELDDVDSTPPWQTVAQEAAVWRDALATGKTRQTGTTTVDGHAALVLESVPGKWTTDEPSQVTTMVVDAQTFEPYDIKTVLSKLSFSQDIAIRSFETLDRTAATEGLFTMTPHHGAKHAQTAAKKHTAKKKAKAKKHAARKGYR
jgi:hypothetical protein